MRGVSPGSLGNVISSYNQNVAGQPTPAGQVLISQGLFTLSQLQAMGAVAPTLPGPVAGTVGLAWLKDVGMSLRWRDRIKGTVTIAAGIGVWKAWNSCTIDVTP